MSSSPAFQFYPKQYLADDKYLLMDWDARGMHVHLMCIAWQQDDACTLPDDDELLRRWVGNPPDWDRLKKQIFRAWKKREDGRWLQEGLLREWQKQSEFRKSRRRAAVVRWEKKAEENTASAPNEPDATTIKEESTCNARALHVQCSSSSTSSSSAEVHVRSPIGNLFEPAPLQPELPKAAPPPRTQTDAEWRIGLQKLEIYQGVDVEKEYGKLLAWCSVRKFHPTRRRFINWLNTAITNRPMSPRPSAPDHTIEQLRRATERLKNE